MTATVNLLKLRAHKPNFGIDANRYFAALPAIPSIDCRVVINTHMVALANAGIITQLDALYYHLMPTKPMALVNAVNPGTFSLVETPTVTHTAGIGDQGANGLYNTGLARNAAGIKFQRTSAMILQYVVNSGQTAPFSLGTTSSGQARLVSRNASDQISGRINDTASLSIANTNGNGTVSYNRSATGARQVYWNGAAVASDTQASVAVGSDVFTIFSDNGAQNTNQVAITAIGASLTATQQAAFHAANVLLVAQAATACLN